MKTLARIFILMAMAAGCALLEGILVGMPDTTEELDEWALTVDDAIALEPVIWVDARPVDAYLTEHVEGAVHISLDNWDMGLGELLQEWEPESAIIVYCDGNGCESSRAIAEQLRAELSVTNVYWLVNGWPALQEKGLTP